MKHTQSTSGLMDRAHPDGMWFSSWENSLLSIPIGGGEKNNNLLVQNGHTET